MNALVQMMKYPESQVPANSARAARKWPRRPESPLAEHEQAQEAGLQKEREEPLHRQRLTDDAAGDTSRTRAQFVPNWNSIGMPVTTPMAKLMPNTRIQNRAASSQRGFPVRSASAFITTISSASPIVSWGKR